MAAKKIKDPTPMEATFLKEYFKDFNASRSALVAGYDSKKPHNARVTGCQLLKKPHIKHWVDEYKKEIKDRSKVETEELVVLLREILHARITDYIDPAVEGGIDLTDKSPNIRAVLEYTVDETVKDNGDVYRKSKIKLRDPISAVERLAKLCGLDQPEQVDHSVKVEFID